MKSLLSTLKAPNGLLGKPNRVDRFQYLTSSHTNKSSSGLIRWTFETERYFGPNYPQVKSTNTVKILPLETGAVEPEYKLQYEIKV